MISFGSAGFVVVFTEAGGLFVNKFNEETTGGVDGMTASLNISCSFWNYRFDASFRSAGPGTVCGLASSAASPDKGLIWGGPASIMKSPTLLMTSFDCLAASAEFNTSGDEESELDFFAY